MPRETRRAKNQQLFREVNELIATAGSEFETHSTGLSRGAMNHDFVCECGTIGCSKRVTTSLANYARARADPETFLVATGHEDELHEDVVADVDNFVIVQIKSGVTH